MSLILLFHRPGHDRDALVNYLTRAGYDVSLEDDFEFSPRQDLAVREDWVTVIHAADVPTVTLARSLPEDRVLLLGDRPDLACRRGWIRLPEPYYLSRVVAHVEELFQMDAKPKHEPVGKILPAPDRAPAHVAPPFVIGHPSFGHLVSGLAHALNNPLAAASGWLQLAMADVGRDDSRSRALQQVRNELRRLERLTLALSSLSGVGIQAGPVDIHRMLERLMAPLIQDGLSAALDVRGTPLPQIDGDPVRLELMLDLLLGSFLEERSRARHLDVLVQRTGGDVELKFSDDGGTIPLGLEPADLSLLMQRVRHTRALGIALAYALTKDGDPKALRFEPKPDGTAALLLRLPVTKSPGEVHA